jgi:hypothetical protein
MQNGHSLRSALQQHPSANERLWGLNPQDPMAEAATRDETVNYDPNALEWKEEECKEVSCPEGMWKDTLTPCDIQTTLQPE